MEIRISYGKMTECEIKRNKGILEYLNKSIQENEKSLKYYSDFRSIVEKKDSRYNYLCGMEFGLSETIKYIKDLKNEIFPFGFATCLRKEK